MVVAASSSAGAGGTDLELKYWERGPPLAAIAALQLAGLPASVGDDDKFTKDSQPALILKAER